MDSIHKNTLLKIAREAIRHGVEHGKQLHVDPADFDVELREPLATFITIYLEGKLAGCIGSLEANGAVIQNIAANAYSAAFRDSRFKGISRQDLEHLSIEIALLSPLEEIKVESEEDLKRQIKVNIHGLLIEEGNCRATFLPKVWQSLPDKDDFLAQLKMKAGLGRDYWSREIRCYFYTAESFSDV